MKTLYLIEALFKNDPYLFKGTTLVVSSQQLQFPLYNIISITIKKLSSNLFYLTERLNLIQYSRVCA
ncbi:hypothetical protein N9I33_01225 [Paracoccaceae bacterium]|nr:hypothetical protein [Paracoccaceae bacterium]